MNKRSHTIDVIKGIAIIMVLITHYDWTPEQRRIVLFPFAINMAIPLFMIVTGFVYASSMKRGGIASFRQAYRVQPLLKRTIRYTLPLLFVVLWEITDPHFTLSSSFLDILRWIVDGTAGKGSYYYPVIMQVVFFFPIIFFIIESNQEKGLFICLVLNAAYEFLAWAYRLNAESYRLLAFRYIFLIAAGVYAFKGYTLKRATALIMTTVGVCFIILISYFGYETRVINASWAPTNFLSSMLVAPLMIWVLQNLQIRFLPLEIVGRASYHIFLVQMGYYLGYFGLLREKMSSWPRHFLAGIAISLFLGIAFYYAEDPVERWIKRKLENFSF